MSDSPPSRAQAKAIRVPSGANDGVVSSPGNVVSGVTRDTRPKGVECARSKVGGTKYQTVPITITASVANIATAAFVPRHRSATRGGGASDCDAPPSGAVAAVARLIAASRAVTGAVAPL